MVVLGFDQSTTKTGWCVFEDNDYQSSGVIDYSKMKKEPEKRLLTMAEAICEQIDSINPDRVVFEDIFDNSNIQTLVALGRLQGMIMLHCYEKHIPTTILPASTWRKIVGIKQGKRKECKESAIKFIENTFGFSATTDEADAVCLTQAAVL